MLETMLVIAVFSHDSTIHFKSFKNGYYNDELT